MNPQKNKWKTVCGGAIASNYGLGHLQDQAAHEVLSLLSQGRMLITTKDVSARIEIGRIATRLQEILGEEFWPTIIKHWLTPPDLSEVISGKVTSNARRHLEISMQFYRFSTREGRGCPRSIPADSYLHIIRATEPLPGIAKKKRLIKRLKRSAAEGKIDLYKTKSLRSSLKAFREDIKESGNDELLGELLAKKVRGLKWRTDNWLSALNSDFEQLYSDLEKTSAISSEIQEELRQVLCDARKARKQMRSACEQLQRSLHAAGTGRNS